MQLHMTLDQAHDLGLELSRPADLVVAIIYTDLAGRGGFDGVLDSIDRDIKREMVAEWRDAARAAFEGQP